MYGIYFINQAECSAKLIISNDRTKNKILYIYVVIKDDNMIIRACKILRGAIMLILALLSVMPLRAQVNAEQVTAIGRNVLGLDDYMLAIHYFNLAIKAKDYLAEPYYLRAFAKMKLDDYRGSEADCSTAIARSKYMTEAYRLRGFVRQHLGLDSLAIEDYNYGLAENPKDKELIYFKAIAQLNLKQYEQADSALTALISDNPKFFEAITARGQVRLERGDTIDALRDFEESLNVSKSQEYPYAMQAQLYAERQEWHRAIEAMNEVIRLYPDRPDLYINRAFMRYKDDDYTGAMSDYNETIHLDPYNTDALFNRALLHFEVLELKEAADDFSRVLSLDPSNFHALYNRALIYLQTKNYKKAESDFKLILKKYPRYYPAYYVLAECRQAQGDQKGAIQYMLKGDELVRKYVANPRKNQLDRPTIAENANRKSKNDGKKSMEEGEGDVDFMDKFNQLVTTEVNPETSLSFNDKYKGRVQDRETSLAPVPLFYLSVRQPKESLKAVGNYFRELGDLNNRRYISETIYLNEDDEPLTESEVEEAFALLEKYSRMIDVASPRAVDYIARGVVYSMLRNYENALEDFNEALKLMPDYTVALMGKGYASARMILDSSDASPLREASVIDVYDEILRQNPMLVYAWFNKGFMLYSAQDFASAEECFSKAVEINPELGQAYYNRGLARMKQGKKDSAFSDFSKAGELGILQGYRVMKSLQ